LPTEIEHFTENNFSRGTVEASNFRPRVNFGFFSAGLAIIKTRPTEK
jgi:hypothetical protein